MNDKQKIEALRTAVQAAYDMFKHGHAIDAFDWGKSSLSADNIRELNETPGILCDALRKTA